jgi:hypothetical protein
MSDLVEKYFSEDLTEAERKTLGQELLSSEEAAGKFIEKAGDAYRRFGLPEPHWIGPEELKHISKPGLWRHLWFWILILGSVGITVYWYRGHNSFTAKYTQPTSKPKQAPILKPTTSVSVPAIKKEVKQKPLISRALTVTQTGPLQQQRKIDVPTEIPALPELPSNPWDTSALPLTGISPKFTPVNVDKNPNLAPSSLSVLVNRTTPGFLTVRVLDNQGVEVLPLYRGDLPAGSWAFEWNGLLKDGRLAAPGLYKIEVRAGSWVQIKEVMIQK